MLRYSMWWKKQPTFNLKVKQNRYERFIIDELKITGVSRSQLSEVLIQAIEEITQKLEILNGDAE